MHIADHHPDAKLAPPLRTPERSHFYKWLVFLTNTVQAEVMTYHYPENHTDDPAQEAAVKRIAAERTMKAWPFSSRTWAPARSCWARATRPATPTC